MQLNEVMIEIGIDVPTLRSRFSNNDGLVERFIRKFPQDKTFGELCDAVSSADYEQMERAAHTLKGISANLGFEKLFALCSRLVADLRAQNRDSAEGLFREIKAERERVTSLILRLDPK